jgi:nitrogen fixation NifU-like protein
MHERGKIVLSAVAAEHVNLPGNAGQIQGATHIGVGGTPGDGPYIRLWLVIEDDIVKKAGYECNGCPSSTAAASMVAQLAAGRAVDRLALLQSSDLLLILGGLPEGKEYYADLAVKALRHAISREN